MKKKLLYFFIFFIVVIIIVGCFTYYKTKNNKKDKISKTNDSEFVINKIQYYSTANAISNTTSYQNPEWNLKVYQYTDIAIYLDRLNDVSENNYITELEISNIKLPKDSEELYYINPMSIGKSTLEIDSKIDEKLQYTVINTENKDNEQTYNIPIFFQDCSNPITLRFVNYLADNYKVSSDNSLVYNGSLIRELGLKVKDLDCKIGFDLIVNTRGEKRTKRLEIEIPFEKSKKSILDGDIEIKEKTNIQF